MSTAGNYQMTDVGQGKGYTCTLQFSIDEQESLNRILMLIVSIKFASMSSTLENI